MPPPELAHPETRALYARLRDGIENADQTWRLTPRFSDLLGVFRRAYVRTPPEVLPILDEADQNHRDGQTKAKDREFVEARCHFERAIEEATKALTMADQMQSVRALRRRSGSKTGISDLILKQQRLTNATALDAMHAKEFLQLAREARDDAQRGLQIDSQLGSPAELRGHRLNLWFNGLICYGQLVDAGISLPREDLLEASSWLEGMASDEVHGDEYVAGLSTEELGGAALLEELRQLGN